jgi:hypothetical protein
MISRQEKMSFLATFLMGLFAGGYLYLTGFATTFEPPEANDENIYTEFVITATTYGQCEADGNCLSFQVLENGTFRAILEYEGQKLNKEERIPFSIRTDLRDELTGTVLALDSEIGGEGCRYEGSNYRFSVTRDGARYDIDTCETLINYEGKGWPALSKLWNHVSTLDW